VRSMKSGVKVTIARKQGGAALEARMRKMLGVNGPGVYLGVPAANNRKVQLTALADRSNGKKRKAKLLKAAAGELNNAELLYIHTNGSPARGIPARPVLQPAVQAEGNRQAIAAELAAAARASLGGDKPGKFRSLKRAGLAGQNAARNWFTDPRNNWAPNAPSTIRRKKSDKPLIDTGALRASITYVVSEE